mmetsp:Transcript_27798/g.40949  ORF Transcript_27798/g.40949 Transcript_27798/m.40949 type:complete len:191 (-) Transcript_27798:669-1241(-)
MIPGSRRCQSLEKIYSKTAATFLTRKRNPVVYPCCKRNCNNCREKKTNNYTGTQNAKSLYIPAQNGMHTLRLRIRHALLRPTNKRFLLGKKIKEGEKLIFRKAELTYQKNDDFGSRSFFWIQPQQSYRCHTFVSIMLHEAVSPTTCVVLYISLSTDTANNDATHTTTKTLQNLQSNKKNRITLLSKIAHN